MFGWLTKYMERRRRRAARAAKVAAESAEMAALLSGGTPKPKRRKSWLESLGLKAPAKARRGEASPRGAVAAVAATPAAAAAMPAVVPRQAPAQPLAAAPVARWTPPQDQPDAPPPDADAPAAPPPPQAAPEP
jgi:hypothetical protein